MEAEVMRCCCCCCMDNQYCDAVAVDHDAAVEGRLAVVDGVAVVGGCRSVVGGNRQQCYVGRRQLQGEVGVGC